VEVHVPLALANLIVTAVFALAGDVTMKPYPRKTTGTSPRWGGGSARLFEILRGSGSRASCSCATWEVGHGRKGALTTYYPEETRWDYAPANRGKHILTQRPDGRRMRWPATCERPSAGQGDRIDPASTPPTPRTQVPRPFEIDYSRCVFCGLCVEACPEDAIRMVKETPACRGSTAGRCGSA